MVILVWLALNFIVEIEVSVVSRSSGSGKRDGDVVGERNALTTTFESEKGLPQHGRTKGEEKWGLHRYKEEQR